MHGIIAKMTATEGKRDELAEVLLTGTRDLPGCISFVVAKDLFEANLIWITEVWHNKADHEASLQLPSVKNTIETGRALMTNMEIVSATEPAGV